MVSKQQLLRTAAVFFSFLFVLTISALSQDLSSIDFKNLKADELSDQQIQQLWQRAQNKGYSISDIERMAIARGVSPVEVQKLSRRLREIRSQGPSQQEGIQQEGNPTLRSVVTTDTTEYLKNEFEKFRRKKSRIFGANIFRSEEINFSPSLNIPTPENYQLGPGDELVIDIWGAAEQTYRLTVSPEGTISFANLGPIYVNGLSIKRARDRIRKKLSKIYSGLQADGDQPTDTQARISLGNIRSIKVTVIGEVRNPGTYTLPSLATAFNALYSAGGPDSLGTFRNIKIIRGDSTAATLDIYNFLVDGNQKGNIRLRDQDIIKVPPYDNRVAISGEAKRKGLFELKEGETIQDLLTFAGGFSNQAYTKRIKVWGNTNTQKRIDDISYPQESGFKLQNGDSVRVAKVLSRFENKVEINGAVFRPGSYQLADSTTLYSLIQRAEGLKEDVFMNRGLIFREQEDLTTEAIPFSLKKLMNNPEQHDIPLQRNDVVQISSIFDLREDYTVNIVGAVQDPGSFSYAEDMSLEDIILQANGFKESAAPYRVEVSRRITGGDSTFVPRETAEIFRFRVNENLELGDKAANFSLKPFDKVYVRNSPSYFKQEEVKVKGEVLFPGTYTLDKKRTRISDLIQRAGGITDYAYPQGANLTRKTGQKIDTTLINIRDGAESSGKKIEQKKTKVGIKLERILNNPGSEQDLILREGDVLEIPRELQTVQVAGEVLYPVGVRYEKKLSMKDYIRAAGGASNLGKPKEAYIVYANGEVDRTRSFLFFKNYPDVRPGATIYVPEKENKQRLTTQERVGILSTIVSMAAIVSNTIFQIRSN
ncbi:protein involved in polysaccharide export, contains SLBB domain of the beta-grasp fold [Fodinibius salinus]|uniref:Protein involved in polysaccharide export, contains SLBB domain of the beta-grasp fold n=1 Tax=Fodinibius salinus TaxID=860790 RepID=A0A5D3YN60_9BACT|nr:SLBB domain-containing protein [Fodinibius salinus]TYP95615.1 protein involved in polysaccharide export, contains SLBB domain of the beta-grasp fold [Fodinibius salinus]